MTSAQQPHESGSGDAGVQRTPELTRQPETTRQPASTPARETLDGDRLCMQCLHPLLGRTIERDADTGLLFVRCGECGTPSALFEYPTATPWINRIKSVTASTLAALVIAAAIALAAATGGFSGASTSVAAQESGEALVDIYARTGPTTKAPTDAADPQTNTRWGAVDEAWLASDAGQAAISASRRSWNALLPFVLLQAIGLVVATPFAIFLGIGLLRHSALRRAIWCALPAVVGSGIALAIHAVDAQFSGVAVGSTRAWSNAANASNLPFFATVSLCVMVGYAALAAVVSPAIAAFVARTILPPRDRRLVGWLWEWRGKLIPRD